MAKRSIITKHNGIPIDVKEDEIVQSKPIEVEIVNLPLTDEEREEHSIRIKRIQDGLQEIAYKSMSIWEDLQYIRAHRTYRETYDTWNDFCKRELGKDNSQIYRYLKDAKFKEELLLIAADDTERSSIMSLKESNTRWIRTLPEDVQVPLWKLAYGIGLVVLPKKEDGSIEPTTAYLNSVGERVNELAEKGGIHLEGEFIPVTKIQRAAQVNDLTEDDVKGVLLSVGVSEEYFEAIKRQEQHIREKSAKADFYVVKGTMENKVDVNGSDYPIIIDSKGNEIDLNELLLSFNNRFITLSVKAPLHD